MNNAANKGATMHDYNIFFAPTGVFCGVYRGRTEAEAAIAMYRDDGYGEGQVWLDGDDVISNVECIEPSDLIVEQRHR